MRLRRSARPGALLGALGVLSACGAAPTIPAAAPPVAPPAHAATADVCGTRTGPPAVDKVLVVWEENHDYGSVIGSHDAPYLDSLAAGCGLATAARALTHPSLPNYLAATSGRSYAMSPWDGDCAPTGGCTSPAPSVFSQEARAGGWRSYVESMPSPCARSDAGPYAVRHNPATYYDADRADCARNDVPLGGPESGPLAADVHAGTLPALSVLVPNLDHDMHDGTVAQADAWLRGWLGLVTAGADYRSGHLAVLVAWDEGSSDGDVTHVPLLVLSAGTPPGSRSTVPYDGYSILRTCEELTGVALLGAAAGAPSLAPAFAL